MVRAAFRLASRVRRQSAGLAVGAIGCISGAAFLAACSSTPPSGEKVGQVSSAVFTNGGFEMGAAAMPPGAPWAVQTSLNPAITVQTPQTLAGLNLAAGGLAKTILLASAAGQDSQVDTDLGAAASLRWPRYGAQSALVNREGMNKNVNALTQTMTVGAGDVDPSDGLVHVRFAVAPVLQNPVHTPDEQPYYFVLVSDVTTGTVLYSDFNLSGAGIAWKKINAGAATEIDYTDWQLVDVSSGSAKIAMGDMMRLEIVGAGCSLGGHFGEIYVDGIGPVIPGISVEGAGPAQANPGGTITYTFTYKNGAAGETGAVVTIATPANTTFQSLAATGLTCTTPAAGAAGTVTCTLGALAAGASGTFTVTVNVLATATGTIVEGTYQIQSDQETPLDGPAVRTLIGCAADSNCPGGTWCDESANSCTPTLANGTALPTDAAHMNPTLNGMCTTSAAMLVCTSAVCDTDNKCGFAVGDGPCTVQTGSIVCRSGACSTNATCEPMGGCNVDGDCTTGNWCNNLVPPGACQPKVANGQPVPGGSCVTAVATRACGSTTCVATGALAGTCEACASDANCAAPTPVCNTVSATCVGAPIEAGPDGAGEEAGEDASAVDASDATLPSDAGLDAELVEANGGGPDGRADAGDAALAEASDGAADASDAGTADATTTELVDANDAEPTTSEEASEGEDAEASVSSPPPTGGSIEGGGLSCSMSTSPGPDHGTFLGILLGACALGASRRRRVNP
jgi:uncharacterized repeat protein (TIGR01451 family)